MGFEGLYEVSDHGRVRSVDRVDTSGRRRKGKVRTPAKQGYGHLGLMLSRGSAGHKRFVHRLVLEAFVGPAPEGADGCHLDGDPSNNHVSNLRWDTRRGNMADAKRHGTAPRGERSGGARATEAQVREIFALRKAGLSLSAISHRVPLRKTQIHNILTGKRWGHLGLAAQESTHV